MGGSSSKEEAPPPYLPDAGGAPLGVFARYAQHGEQMVLRLQEHKGRSVASTKFAVEDALTGQTVFTVDSKSFTAEARKKVYGADGEAVVQLKKVMYSANVAYEGVLPAASEADEQRLFSVVAGPSIGKAQLNVRFKDELGGAGWAQLTVQGDWARRSASIRKPDGSPVAHVTRSKPANAKEVVANHPTYYLMIAPRVDAALIVAAAIALDAARPSRFGSGNPINFGFST